MVDFTKLLSRPAGEAKKPPILPAGDYPGIIKAWKTGESRQNRTPFVSFTLGLMAFPADLDEADTQGIDLEKRQLSRDFYITEDALYRLDEFIHSCGVETTGRAYEEVLPELIGAAVLVEVSQYINQRTNEIGNQVAKLVGAA